LLRGGACTALTKKGLHCPIHGDRLVDDKWLCHVHDPDGTFQRQHRKQGKPKATLDVEVQMVFEDPLDTGAELFSPPSKEAARIAARRAGSFVKWSRESHDDA